MCRNIFFIGTAEEGCDIIKTTDKIIVVSIFGIFILLIAYLLLVPYILSGPASSFLVVHNHDVKSHTVIIDVLDSGNTSIITETYELGPESDISQKRPWGLRLPLSKTDFTINITVDHEATQTYHVELPHPHTTANIRLYYEDYTGNVTPIKVEVVALL